MNAELFLQVKRKLNITWEDSETDARVKDIIKSAIPTLKHKLGITDSSFDFATESAENTLFLAYCLYEWNHSTNEFDVNYANDIAQIRMKNEVAFYLANNAERSANADE